MALDKPLHRRSRHHRSRRRAVARWAIRLEPVLHVADEARPTAPAFKADERALSRPTARSTEARTQAVLDARPRTGCIDTRRQHLLRLAKVAATDGHTFQQMAGSHDRHDRAEYPRHDDQGRPERRRQPQDWRARRRAAPAKGRSTMARITASLYTSHIPAVGRRLRPRQDQGRLLEAGIRRIRFRQAMDEASTSQT